MANNPMSSNQMSSRRNFLLLAASALALSACSSIVGPPDAPKIYVLKPALTPPAPGDKLDWALSLQIPTASDALDSQRIALTHSDTNLDYYADAVWPDRLPLLVQTALLAAFQDSGRIQAVARQQDALYADYNLSIDVRDFAAHYSVPDGAPRISVVLVAQMARARGRKVVANFTTTQSTQASVNSVEAVVLAMDAALGAAIAQITGWALSLPPPPPAEGASPPTPAPDQAPATTRPGPTGPGAPTP